MNEKPVQKPESKSTPKPTPKPTNEKEAPVKKTNKKQPPVWAFIVIGALAIGLIVLLVLFLTKGNNSDKSQTNTNNNKDTEQVYSNLEQIDVNGLTISEACEKVRAAGWKVDEVAGDNDYSEKSDCSDTERKVSKYYYRTEKYYSWGDARSDYETVSLRFKNEKKETEPAKPQETTTTNNSSSSNSSSSSSSSSSNSSSSSSSSKYQTILDKYTSKMRSECPTLSISECAEIYSEGLSEMADYLWSASGTDGQYQTYSDWADKLWDVYMESAQ